MESYKTELIKFDPLAQTIVGQYTQCAKCAKMACVGRCGGKRKYNEMSSLKFDTAYSWLSDVINKPLAVHKSQHWDTYCLRLYKDGREIYQVHKAFSNTREPKEVIMTMFASNGGDQCHMYVGSY